MYNVYISSSTQSTNVGVGQYGTEQDRMTQLADRVKYWLETQKKFMVFRNNPKWSLSLITNDCNTLGCDLFVDNHTNAGDPSASGTEVFYYHQGGPESNSYKLANALYKEIAPLSPGKDRGVLPDNKYVSGLHVIQNTKCPSALVEHLFHTNQIEVTDMIVNMDKYAKAEAKGICKYLGVAWVEPNSLEDDISKLVADMVSNGIVTDKVYWHGVFKGKITPKPEYLQIAFRRAVGKL